MVKARIDWIDGVEGIFVDGFESIIVKVDIEVCLFVILNKKLKLLSSLCL